MLLLPAVESTPCAQQIPISSAFYCIWRQTFIELSGWVRRTGSLSGRGCPALRTEGMKEMAGPGAAGGRNCLLSFHWGLEASLTNANFL